MSFTDDPPKTQEGPLLCISRMCVPPSTQFESLAGFSAVIDRLGQFEEVMAKQKIALLPAPSSDPEGGAIEGGDRADQTLPSSSGNGTDGRSRELPMAATPTIELQYLPLGSGSEAQRLLTMQGLTVCTPDGASTLVKDLSLKVRFESWRDDLITPSSHTLTPSQPRLTCVRRVRPVAQITSGQSLLIMGPSGSGKTSIMRALAGLWRTGSGRIAIHVDEGDVMFLPQRTYMVVGSLRDQLLYPKWQAGSVGEEEPKPSTEQIVEALHKVRLSSVLARYNNAGELAFTSGRSLCLISSYFFAQHMHFGDSSACACASEHVLTSSFVNCNHVRRLQWQHRQRPGHSHGLVQQPLGRRAATRGLGETAAGPAQVSAAGRVNIGAGCCDRGVALRGRPFQPR